MRSKNLRGETTAASVGDIYLLIRRHAGGRIDLDDHFNPSGVRKNVVVEEARAWKLDGWEKSLWVRETDIRR